MPQAYVVTIISNRNKYQISKEKFAWLCTTLRKVLLVKGQRKYSQNFLKITKGLF